MIVPLLSTRRRKLPSPTVLPSVQRWLRVLLTILAKRHVRVKHVVRQVLLSSRAVHRRQKVHPILFHLLLLNAILLLLAGVRTLPRQMIVTEVSWQPIFQRVVNAFNPIRVQIGQVAYNRLTLAPTFVLHFLLLLLAFWIHKHTIIQQVAYAVRHLQKTERKSHRTKKLTRYIFRYETQVLSAKRQEVSKKKVSKPSKQSHQLLEQTQPLSKVVKCANSQQKVIKISVYRTPFKDSIQVKHEVYPNLKPLRQKIKHRHQLHLHSHPSHKREERKY